MKPEENKVVYFHINPLRNEVFYVGIGGKYRPVKKIGRSDFWHNEVNKHGYIIDIVESGLTLEHAKERERFYINKIGRRSLGKGTLVNLTDGGDSGNGMKYWLGKKRSEELKKKISETKKSQKLIAHNKGITGVHKWDEKRKEEHTSILICEGCKIEYKTPIWRSKNRRFCSKNCFYKRNKI